MGRLRRSRTHSSAKSQIKSRKTKRYTRDLDQIALDMELAQAIRSVKPPKSGPESFFVVPQNFGSTSHPTVTGDVDEDTSGCGQFPCVECARFFVDSRSLTEHQRGKVHKRRVKELAAGPYSLEEAMRAAGLGTDNRQRPAPDLMVT
ncbi:hypothetical protein PTTG_00982 [Puccinia triticina 1-1 BBBD Race 1]|uniref:C2H2-type domain-containing protein n=1 Tax=Puccinia triticina (isolate 1-1 / race 1 (BBBD)) TaxID=630390 RepID=A0A0C4EJR1_PUCT1|nr:hypothetical protein PTTG_00982 [Puccinia triticina 1-1 BBBD Race 1]